MNYKIEVSKSGTIDEEKIYFFESESLDLTYRWIDGSHTVNVYQNDTCLDCFSSNYGKSKITKRDILTTIKQWEKNHND